MANDVKLGESQPIDIYLRPLKVGGEPTCLEISKENGVRITGDLELIGDIISQECAYYKLKLAET